MAVLAEIVKNLTIQGFPTPDHQWLTSLISSQRAGSPVLVLSSTARARLLASDIAVDKLFDARTPGFPNDVNSPSNKELKFAGPILVQVLGVEDLSQSRWEQIEAIEAFERGETTKGREIIRVVASETGEDGAPVMPQAASRGPHRLVLQDAKSQTVYGIELKSVKGVELNMNIGTKLLFKSVLVARGIVLIEPETVTLLGGKIDSLDKAWKENRKKELKEALEASQDG